MRAQLRLVAMLAQEGRLASKGMVGQQRKVLASHSEDIVII